jgi:acetoin utilization deacetylase AcuC-like enzyme
VHTPEHIALVRMTAEHGGGMIDADTYVTPDSYAVARRAVGSTVHIVDHLMRGPAKRGMSLLRPPGHHATASQPMGFCLFNNVAVAARAANVRTLILDWDVHHGNGTQDIFYSDATVGYFSVHQSPLYPGSGSRAETGEGAGLGYTLNCPTHAGSGDNEWLAAVDEALGAFYDRVAPQLVIVSAGFDAHARDPLASCEVTTAGYAQCAAKVLERAGATPVLFALEGGYDTAALSESVVAVARACFAG